MLLNKRGNIAITILVFLVATLVFSSVFIFFTTSGKASAKIYDAKFLDSVYVKQNLAEFYLRHAGENMKNSGYSKESFKKKFEEYDFDEDYLKELKKIISEDKFNLKKEDKILEIVVNEWKIKDLHKNIVTYIPKISVKFRKV
ncbi:hypothetical protein CMI44_02500 [Candidatus Pacearchaeota archaeon]|nr:hypothetical protein [Candidatus Pacearchaeota archaeon]|tara:strand:- start:1089 stop:1517 length:429 start_codon:yes stop_codon:yes gene_type:complete